MHCLTNGSLHFIMYTNMFIMWASNEASMSLWSNLLLEVSGGLLAFYHDNKGQWEFQLFFRLCFNKYKVLIIWEQNMWHLSNPSVFFKFHDHTWHSVYHYKCASRISNRYLNFCYWKVFVFSMTIIKSDIMSLTFIWWILLLIAFLLIFHTLNCIYIHTTSM